MRGDPAECVPWTRKAGESSGQIGPTVAVSANCKRRSLLLKRNETNALPNFRMNVIKEIFGSHFINFYVNWISGLGQKMVKDKICWVDNLKQLNTNQCYRKRSSNHVHICLDGWHVVRHVTGTGKYNIERMRSAWSISAPITQCPVKLLVLLIYAQREILNVVDHHTNSDNIKVGIPTQALSVCRLWNIISKQRELSISFTVAPNRSFQRRTRSS